MAIKILIGGSPCTHWSIAQTNNRETEPEGMGWELFKNYLIAKGKFKPDFFLYENNKSASQAIKDQIAKEFGVGVDPDVRFTYINSALVSAQNRQRFYVTNFGDIEQPEDRGILLKDILETGYGFGESEGKSFCQTASYYKGKEPEKVLTRHERTHVAEPVLSDEMTPPCGQRNQEKARTLTSGYANKSQRDLRKDIETDGFMGAQGVVEPVNETVNGKSYALTASYYKAAENPFSEFGEKKRRPRVAEPVNITPDGKSQTIKAQYQNTSAVNVCCYKSTYGATGVAEPIQVGSLPRPNGELSTSQAMRIYAQDGKSVTQSAGGGGLGGKTGLYAIPVEFDNGVPTKAVSYADGKTYTVYKVYEGKITIKDKEYPIKLKDGYYIIRKLTVRECARLQTMPDDYCKAVSDSQAYKALGNGWTAEVIIHLLNHALKDVPRDEEIVVLSMYDGIATGRYCLDKMGFTNVKYHAYEIDKYPITVALDNYPDIIQHGDAFAVRENDWKPPQTRAEWLAELLGGDL